MVRSPIIYDKVVSLPSKGQELLERMFDEKTLQREADKTEAKMLINPGMSTVGVSRKVYRKPKRRRMF